MFHKFTPLEDKNLKESIEDLMKKAGFVSSGIFVSDASKRDTRLNAYFGGFGKTKRVVLFDTLIEAITKEELLAVLAHELGHFYHRHLYKGMFATNIVFLIFFFVFGNIPPSLFSEIGIIYDSSNIILISMILFAPLSFFVMPIMNYIYRVNEFEADKYSKESINKIYLIEALTKLSTKNSAFPKAHKLYTIFHHTHPLVVDRIAKLNGE
jgi:STE24 endopeptidase